MTLLDPRDSFKPFEYDVVSYKNAINNSYWLVSEWNFISDVQDFHVRLAPHEREIIRKTLLAISQIEVAVKRFWVTIGTHFPKPEIEQVGITFGEAEVRHADAYSHLLSVLGIQDDFSNILSEPVIRNRFNYLTKYAKKQDKDYLLTLALFTIFTENVSLFSQFLIIKSFSKEYNVLKDIDNVVQATQKEELVHALFGMYLIKELRKEFPEWFDDNFTNKLTEASVKAYTAEAAIIDWIYQDGELPFLPASVIKEFIKQRINMSFDAIDLPLPFEIDRVLLERVQWFNDEIYAEVNTDFFYKRPVTYSKKVQSVTASDLF